MFDERTPLYIFDLDGTLALIDHRRHILNDISLHEDERWKKFFRACVDDAPNKLLLDLLHMLHDGGNEIWIWSCRSDEVIDETIDWLWHHGVFHSNQDMEEDILIKMRKNDDYTPDHLLKQQWVDKMLPEDRKRLVMVFDDRNECVAMWRRNGICCLQVADGDFHELRGSRYA